MICFAVAGLILTLASVVAAIVCTLNFGQGLKAKLLRPARGGVMEMDNLESPNPDIYAPQRLTRRFEID